MPQENKATRQLDTAEQNVVQHSYCSECGDTTLPMHAVDSRLREIMSDIPLRVEDALTKYKNSLIVVCK